MSIRLRPGPRPAAPTAPKRRRPASSPPCAIVALVALTMLATAGCTGIARRALSVLGLGSRYETGISEEQLRESLARLSTGFTAGVATAAEEIENTSSDRETRRRALLWKVRVIPLVQREVGVADPQESFVGLLTLATAQRKYLAQGEGARLFGPQQGIAVVEAERIEADALAVGAKFLSATQLEGIRWQVEDVTWKYPIRGVFQIESATRGFAQSEQWGAFDWVVAIPMSPFRALEGVDTGAQAIMQFNTTAGEFAATVAQLPELMRWQTELLLYDIEGRDTVRAGLAAFETLAASGARLSETAERLPADVRAQVASLLAEVEGRQAALGRTLADARALLADLDGSMARGGALAKVLTRLARQVDRTGATWQAVVAEVRGPERDATAAASRPFDILDYERTLGRVESASTELRGLAAALRDASGTLSGLLDAALWRLLLLLLAFFALRLAFRRLEHRLARRE